MDQRITGLQERLYNLLEQIKTDQSIQTMESVERELRGLRERATPAQILRIERFIANHLLEFPEESQMTPGLRACIDESVNSVYQYKTKAELLMRDMDALCGVELSNQDGTRGAVITKEPSDTSRIRASFFNEHGFFGDMNRGNVTALIDELWHEGYMHLSPGLLQKMSASRAWSEGSSALLDAQLVNQGTMAMSQYYENREIRSNIRQCREIWEGCLSEYLSNKSTENPALISITSPIVTVFTKQVEEALHVRPSPELIQKLIDDPQRFIPPSAHLFEAAPVVESKNTLFVYGLRARPAAIGAVPTGFVKVITPEDSGKFLEDYMLAIPETDRRHGLIVYSQALTKTQIQQFELKVPVTPGQLPEKPEDLSDIQSLKNYAMTLMHAGFITQDGLKSVWRDPEALENTVQSIINSQNEVMNRQRAPLCR